MAMTPARNRILVEAAEAARLEAAGATTGG